MRKNEEDQSAKLVRYVVNVLLGGAVSLGVGFLFLLIASVGISKGWLGEGLMYQLTIVACVVGAFIGGLVAVRRCASRALVVGLLVGTVLFLAQLTVGVVLLHATAPGGGLGLLCGALCGGAAAGLLGSRGGHKKKKRRK